MRCAPLLCVFALLPLQGAQPTVATSTGPLYSLFTASGAFQENRIEHITVVEGQNLDLHCLVAGDSPSALEWKNPSGFVIFFNDWQGLRDPRYKLIRSSEDGLSVRLSNVTKHDKGLYSCSHYSVPFKMKQVNVTISAAPFKTLLEASTIRVPNEEEKVVLKCSTWGHRPRPRITWLLDNGMELFGSTKHQRGANNCNSTSILTVQRCPQNAAISCVIRHKALGGGNVTVTLHIKDIKLITDFTPTTLDFSTITSEKPHDYTDSDKTLNVKEGSTTPSGTEATILNSNATEESDKTFPVTEGTSGSLSLSPSTKTAALNSSATNGLSQILNITEGSFSSQTPSPSSGAATLDYDATTDSARELNRTEEKPSMPTPFPGSEAATLNFNASSGPGKILNVTEGNSTAQTQAPNTDITTLNSQTTNGTDLTYEGIVMKKPNILLPVLVTALLFALVIIVLLFTVKLWKAHREWKKEKDVSEQTLESNRSRPNEDQHGQEKERHVVTWKTSKKYAIQRSCMRTSKNSEESQESSVFEKQLPYVKETDL